MAGVLKGKRCLLTGATGGLGRELARELARRGARLFLTGRDSEALRSLVLGRGSGPDGATVGPADLTRVEEVDGLIERVRAAFGGLDVLINSAGVFPVAGIAQTTPEEFERCIAVNLRAPFLLARAFAPFMAEQRWGRIVHIGSSSSYVGFRDTSLYCASKHGLLGLSRALHDELKGSNVRTFCISPGSIQTDMGRKVRGQDFETFLDPAEVAAFVADLISADGPMIVEEVRLNRVTQR